MIGKGGENCTGARIVDVLKRRLGGWRQVRPRAGNPPQFDDDVGIRDRYDGGDDGRRRRLTEQLSQKRTPLAAPELAKRAGRAASDHGMKVTEQLDQHGDCRGMRRGTTAGLRPDCRLGVTQQHHCALGRQPSAGGCGSADRMHQSRSLHHAIEEDAYQDGGRFAPPQSAQRLQRRGLLRGTTWSTPNPLKRRHRASNAGTAAVRPRCAAAKAKSKQSAWPTSGMAAISAASSSSCGAIPRSCVRTRAGTAAVVPEPANRSG